VRIDLLCMEPPKGYDDEKVGKTVLKGMQSFLAKFETFVREPIIDIIFPPISSITMSL